LWDAAILVVGSLVVDDASTIASLARLAESGRVGAGFRRKMTLPFSYTTSSSVSAVAVDFPGVAVVDSVADLFAASTDFIGSVGGELGGTGCTIWVWYVAVGRSHPMREPMSKLTVTVARMARVPRTRVHASEGERRAGRGLAAMKSSGGMNSGVTPSDRTGAPAGFRLLSSMAAWRTRAHSSAKPSSSFWSELEKAAGECEKTSRTPAN